jgi:hypothetical protein
LSRAATTISRWRWCASAASTPVGNSRRGRYS